ncbi:PREDICTED: peptidyl-prolyl cis-trans isomerase FKBP17-1, chloroplastic isoform X2 [Camelina sativa]|uniref:peptidylprolyl isomerase n=1 Tax=Camelina sativa TaxID=90675 RepID=A0ABM0V174_CAMSA|nr:PREDICTED: peptidyl-prolyl cis-trans isomerase FKBP17-1, chloroplastic isoform X2 [Camelina sativa]
MIRCVAWTPLIGAPFITTVHFTSPPSIRIFASRSSPSSIVAASRRSISLSIIAVTSSVVSSVCFSSPALAEFSEIPDSGGVKSLDLRIGDGEVPIEGDQIEIHYYGRLAAKQGWRFDSTYDHKDSNGEAVPFTFVLGSSKVIRGIETAVRSMKVGGIRRVVIPPSQGYQNTSQEPLPPNFFDRQRLFTTIFNPTRLANGEGSTLGTLVFDIELVSTRKKTP